MTSSAAMFPIVTDGIHILPVMHERIEYADLVRLAMADLRPDAVAVEIPSSLERTWLKGIDRLPEISVLLYENAGGDTIYLPIQPADPLVEAARTARELEIEVCCADLDVDGYADYRDPGPDAYALLRLGPDRVFETFRRLRRPFDRLDRRREVCMAYNARRLRSAGAKRVLLVCGMHHADSVARELGQVQAAPLTPPVRKNVRLVHLHPESLGEVLTVIPFYVAVYEARRKGLPAEPQAPPLEKVGRPRGPFRVLGGGRDEDTGRIEDAIARAARDGAASPCSWPNRTGPPTGPGPVDRLRLQWSLAREAEVSLTDSAPDETMQAWQRRLLARYTRNLARASGQLVVDLFDLLAAARSCVSENFAWEVHRLAVAYTAQRNVATDLPTARISADELYDGVRRIRLQRRVRRPKRPDWRRLLRKRKGERWSGEWLEGFSTDTICSYPPEDLVVEDFGRYLRKRGRSILSEERTRTVPFTTSILDGIDMRETIRNWHERKIMVRELGRAPGMVGSVVLVFRDEGLRDDPAFPYLQTWHGEHDQESDMAFYCTDPAQGIVGPGICRTTYGGFMLSHPPGRMADVWTDPDYAFAETKGEVLLLAALDYCTENVVVYVAARPPRSILQQLARRLNLKILYLPLGSLSPPTLKRVSVMHILSGHDKREVARDYVW